MASQEGLVLSRSISWFSRVPTGCWGSRSRCRPPGRALSWQGLGKLRIPFPSGTLYVMAELTFSAFFSCWYGRLKINVYVRIGKLMVFANRTLLQHDFFSHPVSNRNHIYTFSLVPTPPLPMKAGDPGRTSHHVLTLWRLQLTSVRNTKSTQGHWRTSWRRIPRQAQVWSPGHCQSRIQALRSSIPAREVAWYAVCAGNVFANEFDAIGKGDAAARVGVVGEMLTCNRVLEFYSIINQH